MINGNNATPGVRVTIMLIATIAILFLSFFFTGSFLPKDPRNALIFQNALLLIVLGSAILEHHFTKPADSLINSLMAFITLLTVYSKAPRLPWLIVSIYCFVVFLISLLCVSVSTDPQITGWKQLVAKHTYKPSILLGKSRVIFSIIFIMGLLFFYSVREPITLALLIFWGVFVVIWPLRIPELFTTWFNKNDV